MLFPQKHSLGLNHPLKLTVLTGSRSIFCCAAFYDQMMANVPPGLEDLGVLGCFFHVCLSFILILNMIAAKTVRVNFSTSELLPSVGRWEREKQYY